MLCYILEFKGLEFKGVDSLQGLSLHWLRMLIPTHLLLSGEPHECSIGIQTDKVVHTGVMFCLSLL